MNVLISAFAVWLVAATGLAVRQPPDSQSPQEDTPAAEPADVEAAESAATDPPAVAAAPDADAPVTFARMTTDEVAEQVRLWLQSAGVDPAQEEWKRWADADSLVDLSAAELLDSVVESFAAADPAVSQLVQQARGAGPLDAIVYDGIREAPFFRQQVNLYRGRWLGQHRFYDEALELLAELKPDDVIDPAALLFYRGICQAELLQRRDAVNSLSLLLNNTVEVPERYRVVAAQLQQDLKQQQDEGLNQVARLMKDVERRLDLGRSGDRTQNQEQAVIAAIDKLMDELEQQQQQQQQSGGADANGSQPNQGNMQNADRSQIKGSPAEGIADRKDLTEKGKWGLLDDQAEAQARELIRQRFPPNFLDQIGRYTKKLAERNSN